MLKNVERIYPELGSETIQLVRLDDYLQGERINVLKLDIEGAECKALKGAKNTIVRSKPRLMLSIYHNGNDLWDIFRYTRNLFPGYRFSIGHHSQSMFETVLYAH